MKDENTLLQLGFRKEGVDLLYQGKHRLFRATVMFNGRRSYVWLHVDSGEIDKRPLSINKDKPLWKDAGDCCSAGSVERRILFFDKPINPQTTAEPEKKI